MSPTVDVEMASPPAATPPSQPVPLLRALGLSKTFGGIRAVETVSLELHSGTAVGIVGPNGSGKSTLFNLICGNLRPDAGEVHFLGRRIDGLPVFRVAQRGIGRTFQTLRVFRSMSVMENLLFPAVVRKVSGARARAEDLLEFVGLVSSQTKLAGELSFGQQRLLEFAVALMAQPKLLILDEPIAGVNPVVIEKLAGMITQLRQSDLSFLIVEHNIRFVNGVCDRVIVLDHGCQVAEGTPDQVRSNADVIEAYLGKGLDAARG